MDKLTDLKPPDGFDWRTWLDRHDRMHERYFIMRDERFELIARWISATQKHPSRVLDLGCGAGALMLSVLEALPRAEVIGIDFDPTVLWLSDARLERFGERSRLIMTDFLDESWPTTVEGPLDAVISSQTLHMLDAGQLVPLYHQIAQVLRPGGIFLSADHVRSDSSAIQEAWERQSRSKERLPLVWHLSRLLDSGFRSAECFWRCESDAVYGGERSR